MKGGVMLNSQRVYALLDLKATYSFVSYKVVNKLNILIGKLSRGSAFSTLDLKATYSFVSLSLLKRYNFILSYDSRVLAFKCGWFIETMTHAMVFWYHVSIKSCLK